MGLSGGLADNGGLPASVPSGSPLSADKRFYASMPPYNVKADGKTVTDAAITAGQATLSSASATFTGADNGKLCVVVGAGTPISGTTSGSMTSGVPVTTVPVNALAAAIPPGGVFIGSQTFVTSGALTGATTLPILGSWVAEVGTALTTGGPITTITVASLNAAVASGTITLSYVDSSGVPHTQTFSTAGAAIGATTITVTSLTPNYAFPIGTMIYGNPGTFTPNTTYSSATTVKTGAPALSTTIQSVSAGVATLAANAGTTVSGAECFYATDDTVAAQACLTAAAAVNGAAVFPFGDIGLSAPLSGGTGAHIIQGQGVLDLYAATGGNNLAFPTVVPYLKGTVFVQCSPNTDGIQLTPDDGVAQSCLDFGVRFAGRYLNTGNGITSTPPNVAHWGNINGFFDNVHVYGHDGNHYGFVLQSWMLNSILRCRAYGGGGTRLYMAPGVTGGNYSFEDYYSCTLVAGTTHGLFIDSPSSSGIFQYCNFKRAQTWVIAAPSQPTGTVAANSSQLGLLTTSPANQFHMEFSGIDFETNVSSKAYFPTGFACGRSTDPSSGVANPAMTTTPTSGTGVQNLTGKLQLITFELTLTPLAAASVSTTLNGATAANAISFVVASATGLSVGQGVQIGRTGDTGFMDFAIISAIAGTTITVIASNAAFGLSSAHSNGASVEVGAAVVHLEQGQSNSWPGVRTAHAAAAIGAAASAQSLPTVALGGCWWYRLTWANAQRTWANYSGSVV